MEHVSALTVPPLLLQGLALLLVALAVLSGFSIWMALRCLRSVRSIRTAQNLHFDLINRYQENAQQKLDAAVGKLDFIVREIEDSR